MKQRIIGILACSIAFGCAALCMGSGMQVGLTEKTPLLQEAPAVSQTSDLTQAEISALAEAGTDALAVSGSVASSPDVNGDYISPLVTMRADPYLYKHEGMYYFTGSYPEYDRIELTCADSVNGIAAAKPKKIWTAPSTTHHVWAPEIHYIMDQWVIYYACSENGLWDIKCHALKLDGNDPMHDEWLDMGVIERLPSDNFSFNSMSLDMTVFENNARWYAIWAQKPSSSNLYLAEMETPFKIKTKPILLTKPEYSWEHSFTGSRYEYVNEGPAVMKHAGKIFVSYSAAATDANYCMGMLEIDESDDPMIIENWTKYSEPVFKTDASLQIYGPGHNCFVEGDEGEQLCVLHFRNYRDISGDSLYDFNRHAHVMKITFDRRGVPQFHLDPDEVYNSEFSNHH